jgi:hypothetical protein
MTDEHLEKFLISGHGDNSLLICAAEPCEWYMPFPTAHSLLRMMHQADLHATTNHGYIPPVRVEGYLPPGTTVYESEADYRKRRYNPVDKRWLYPEESDYEPEPPPKEPNDTPHPFVPRATFGAVSKHCEECYPTRRRQGHPIHTQRD